MTRGSDVDGTPSALSELRAENEHLKAENTRLKALVEILFDNNPDGIVILNPDGAIVANEAASKMSGDPAKAGEVQTEWMTEYGYWTVDRSRQLAPEELSLMRAMRGEVIDDDLILLISARFPEGQLLQNSARPLPTGGAITIVRNVTDKKQLEDDLRERNEELAHREAENAQLIERLRLAVDELSTPVLEVSEGVLVLPVIGVVDSQRSAQMTERLLGEISRNGAAFVIIDLTGVEVVDTSTAAAFARLAKSAELLGAQCMLSGLSPMLARTLVELGAEFGGLATERNLRHALTRCLAMRASAATGKPRRGGA
jgi:rsbT co-antagonist protein RsbR